MLKNMIVLPDGTEIYSGTGMQNALQSSSVTECVNSGTELTLGSVCASMLEAKIITPGGGLNIAAGTEVTLYKVDDLHTRTKVGLFTLEKPTRPSPNAYKITAYDRISWLDKDLTQWLVGLNEWPYTLYDFAVMVCEECGLMLKNESIPNGSYAIRKFSGSGITGRRLMQWIGEICGRFCRATSEGEIEFAWYTETDTAISPQGEIFYYRNSLTYEDYQTAPIEKVQLRLTEDDVGAVWPDVVGEVNTYIVTGNYLLTTDSTDALRPLAQALYEQLKDVQFTPCKLSIPVNLKIHAGDIVRITDANGKSITTYVMNRKQTGQRDTLECTGSPRRDSSTVVNGETIRALSGKMLEIKKNVEGLSIKASDLETQVNENVESTNKQITEVTQTAEGIVQSAMKDYVQQSEYDSFLEHYETTIDQRAEKVAITVSQENKDSIGEVDNRLDELIRKIEMYFGFESDGLHIRKSGANIETLFANDIWQFMFSGAQQLYIDKNGVHGDELYTKNIYIGDLIFKAEADGSVVLS